MRGLVASTVGAMEVPQAKHRQERKVVWLLLTLCNVPCEQPCGAHGRRHVHLRLKGGSQSMAQGSRVTRAFPGPSVTISGLVLSQVKGGSFQELAMYDITPCGVISGWEVPQHAKLKTNFVLGKRIISHNYVIENKMQLDLLSFR